MWREGIAPHRTTRHPAPCTRHPLSCSAVRLLSHVLLWFSHKLLLTLRPGQEGVVVVLPYRLINKLLAAHVCVKVFLCMVAVLAISVTVINLFLAVRRLRFRCRRINFLQPSSHAASSAKMSINQVGNTDKDSDTKTANANCSCCDGLADRSLSNVGVIDKPKRSVEGLARKRGVAYCLCGKGLINLAPSPPTRCWHAIN